jgi:hypothetical protein
MYRYKYLKEPQSPKSRNSTPHDVRVSMEGTTPNSSIPADYQLLDISKDKDYMAILQTDWKLVVYKLKHTENGIDYEGDKVTYDAGEIDGVNPAYMFLSVCSKTGDVALSFAELEKTSGTFTKRKPETEYKHCRIFRNEKGNCDTIEFQGRAVYANNKLVLVGEHTLQVHHIDSLKMEYFLDLHDLKKGYEAFIGGEDIARQVTWAKKINKLKLVWMKESSLFL